MQDLIKQEQFELEVLNRLHSGKFLNNLVFVGGTMLRLCFDLNRFSIDLDFWIIREIDPKQLFKNLRFYLAKFYTLTDSALKFHTLLFELKKKDYPRSLKIEIRKGLKRIRTELALAYSKYSNTQVLVRVISLQDIMEAKINAFLERKEIRDVFDIEFLYKRGVRLNVEKPKLQRILKIIDSFTTRDYSVKLGSLLEEEYRKYYIKENFKILRLAIKNILMEPE
jgi:predicted nucleotidyltransferase component of viral defense system